MRIRISENKKNIAVFIFVVGILLNIFIFIAMLNEINQINNSANSEKEIISSKYQADVNSYNSSKNDSGFNPLGVLINPTPKSPDSQLNSVDNYAKNQIADVRKKGIMGMGIITVIMFGIFLGINLSKNKTKNYKKENGNDKDTLKYQLEKIKNLLDEGIINEEEYKQKRKDLIQNYEV